MTVYPWLIGIVVVCFNFLNKGVFVAMEEHFCESVFESRDDYALVGHNISSVFVSDQFECKLKCIHTKTCKSFNVHPATGRTDKRFCELNNVTRHQVKPSDFRAMNGSKYYGSVKVCS